MNHPFSFDAVDQIARGRLDRHTHLWTCHSTPTANELGDLLGVTSRTIQRWRRHGLSIDQADRVATRLGLHPTLLWPDWRIPDHDLDDLEQAA